MMAMAAAMPENDDAAAMPEDDGAAAGAVEEFMDAADLDIADEVEEPMPPPPPNADVIGGGMVMEGAGWWRQSDERCWLVEAE